ncbi:MAG: hypothetical protein LLG14_12680 [Nocardiaceae bacterium]|nr:hypothetical protein [Nocardiaceae bacterium]
MVSLEMMGQMAAMIDRMVRIRQRAERGTVLQPWGLSPQNADEGSSLFLDDDGFAPTGDHRFVQSLTLWPVMAATDTVWSASDEMLKIHAAMSKGEKPNLHIPSVVSLLRSGMESAGRTVWALSSEDREERRRRALRLHIQEQEKYQAAFTKREITEMRAGKIPNMPVEKIDLFEEGHNEALADLARLKAAYPNLPGAPGFKPMAEEAGKWLNTHVPQHDYGELAVGFNEFAFGRFYSASSALAHGLTWVNKFLVGPDLFVLLSDGLAAAVNMTECAIALYEAQAQRPSGKSDRVRYYPERLEPTVREWATLYA